MSLYEEGYIWEGRSKFMYTKEDWGNISHIDDTLVFFGSHGHQVKIPLNDIKELEQRKALIHFTLNDGKVWTLLCSPRKYNLGLSEVMACRKKSQNMASVLNYIRKGK